jgi:hypothetical protein
VIPSLVKARLGTRRSTTLSVEASRSDSGQAARSYGLRARFFNRPPHRPTRLSFELEEVDAVRPVLHTAISRLSRKTPEETLCDSSD